MPVVTSGCALRFLCRRPRQLCCRASGYGRGGGRRPPRCPHRRDDPQHGDRHARERERSRPLPEHRVRPHRRRGRRQIDQRARTRDAGTAQAPPVEAVAADGRQQNHPGDRQPERSGHGRLHVSLPGAAGDCCEEQRAHRTVHRQRVRRADAVACAALQEAGSEQAGHPREGEQIGEGRCGCGGGEVVPYDQCDPGQAHEEPRPLTAGDCFAEQPSGQGTGRERLQGGYQCGRSSRDAEADCPDDRAEIDPLGEQPDQGLFRQCTERQALPSGPQAAQQQSETSEQRGGHEEAPHQEGVGGGLAGAEFGTDEARTPHHDESGCDQRCGHGRRHRGGAPLCHCRTGSKPICLVCWV